MSVVSDHLIPSLVCEMGWCVQQTQHNAEASKQNAPQPLHSWCGNHRGDMHLPPANASSK